MLLLTNLDIQTLLMFVAVFLIGYIYIHGQKSRTLPPGPPTWPFIGNVHLIMNSKKVHKTFADLRKQYGDVFCLQLGFEPMVVISNPELIREALIQKADSFSNRPNHYLLIKIILGDYGIINNHGPIWKASRRMAISSLRDFGVGKTSLELKLHDEAKALVAEVSKYKGKPYNCDLLFSKASTNIICSMLFDIRYDYNDPEFITLTENLGSFFQKGTQTNHYCFLPYLLPLVLLNREIYGGIKLMYGIKHYLKKQIKQHRETYIKGTIRDFVDIYLEAESENAGDKAYVEKNLFAVMFDLFIAGSETTSTTLKWAMLFMIKYPHVQLKCREEILQVVGNDITISLSDQRRLPYVEATICEIQRLSSIAPLSVFHCTKGPVEFQGYTLPDKCIVVPHIQSVHLDPNLWEDPELFNPDRFLNSSGKVEKPSSFMPFSIGKRICAGENLARAELFIFFSSFLQKYSFKKEDEKIELPGIHDGLLGVTLNPPPFKFISESL